MSADGGQQAEAELTIVDQNGSGSVAATPVSSNQNPAE
jgi:hypothetical protein